MVDGPAGPPKARSSAAPPSSPFAWHGLGNWNLYFLAKLLLYAGNYLQPSLLWNFVFIAFLVVPAPWSWLNRLRHLAGIPIAIALLYHESWFPPFRRLLASPELLDFSPIYFLELAARLIHWEWIGAAFFLIVAYRFLSQWLRFTAITMTAFTLLAIGPRIATPLLEWRANSSPAVVTRTQLSESDVMSPRPESGAAMAAPLPSDPAWLLPTANVITEPPDDDALNRALGAFHQAEAERVVSFSEPEESLPIDILMVSVCSLSWSDLDDAGLRNHPLLAEMDIILEDFNSATSYSGPAVLRLLRAKCGQQPHSSLYEPGSAECSLMQSLQELGFESAAALNHDGEFQGFLSELRQEGGLPAPYIPVTERPTLTAFDGAPIWNDYSTLAGWWAQRGQSDAERTALLYNTITLHDGNREATRDGGGRPAPFIERARTLLDDLFEFVALLERGNRRVLLILVPEHGAALHGDRMQIPGMREVPTPSITRVPVAIKLINAEAAPPSSPILVNVPTSFLALSDLIARVMAGNLFNAESIDWHTLAADLPQTAPVSENEGSVFLQYGGTPFVRMGERNWVRYPQ